MRGKRWRRYESLSMSKRYTVRPYQASVTVTVPLSGFVLILAEIGVGDRLPRGVLDVERLLKLAGGPGCGEAVGHLEISTGRVCARTSN